MLCGSAKQLKQMLKEYSTPLIEIITYECSNNNVMPRDISVACNSIMCPREEITSYAYLNFDY